MMKQENLDFFPNPKTFSGFLMTPTRLGSRGISKAAPSVASGGKERVKEKERKEDPEEASDQGRKEKGEVTTPIRLRPDTTWDDQAWDASPAYKATGAWDPTTGLWIDYAYQDPTAWQTSDWQDDATSWGDTAWFGKDGKGKGKGKKGKGKKGKGKKGNF